MHGDDVVTAIHADAEADERLSQRESARIDFERVNADVFGLADLNPRGLNRHSFRRARRVW